MELLFLLVQKHGDLVTREEVAERLWGTTVFVEVDIGINTAVRKVRMALRDDPDNPRFIETVIGKGYRFSAPVTCSRDAVSNEEAAPGPKESQPIPGATVQHIVVAPQVGLPKRRWLSGLATVLALGVVVVGLLFVLRSNVRLASHPAIRSLAVLPLKNLSGDATQEYLADGITEELIGRLSSIHGLRVISRTSVMRFKDTKLTAPEISKMVAVDALVEGSIIREGNRVRVQAQLIRGATDEHFWSESYDRKVEDLLTLETDVAQAIAGRVEVTVTGGEQKQLVKVRSVSPEVYERYLKGKFALSRHKNETDVRQAMGYFEQAVVRDETFAPAYVGLAIGHSLLASVLVGNASPEGERAKAIIAVQRALQLDPELPDAHVELADLHKGQWHWSEAEAEYQRALMLNPNDASAHAGLADWMLCHGRTEEALNWARRARELDPLAVSRDRVGWVLYVSRHYDESIAELRTDLAISPEDIGVLWTLGFVLIANNQAKEAIPVLENAVRISNHSPGVVGVLAKAYALGGQRAKAGALLDELRKRHQSQYVPAAAFVNAYLGLGELDQVVIWLDRGFSEKSNLMQWLPVDPMFDPLRNDPRFVDLVHRVGLL